MSSCVSHRYSEIIVTVRLQGFYQPWRLCFLICLCTLSENKFDTVSAVNDGFDKRQ